MELSALQRLLLIEFDQNTTISGQNLCPLYRECPRYGVSVLERFHCISILNVKSHFYTCSDLGSNSKIHFENKDLISNHHQNIISTALLWSLSPIWWSFWYFITCNFPYYFHLSTKAFFLSSYTIENSSYFHKRFVHKNFRPLVCHYFNRL